MKQAIEILEHKGVKPTPNRIIVMDALLKAKHPVSLAELDGIIETMDRSSIFRSLSMFLDNSLVHGIEDGSGSLKYEVCHGLEQCSISDMHVHFHCESCQSTFCFEDVKIPQTQIPQGFQAHSINYVIKGLCPECSKSKLTDIEA